MPKRIALFIIGFAIALGAFLLYQRFSGASFSGGSRRVRPIVDSTEPGRSPAIEQRDSEGRLEFLITMESLEQLRGPTGEILRGQWALKKPVATFYDKSGRTVEIRGDVCHAVIDQGSMDSGDIFSTDPGAGGGGRRGGRGRARGAAGAGDDKKNDRALQSLRLGQLSGHVRLAISALPEDPQRPVTDPLLMARRAALTVYFDEQAEFDGDQEILSSPGKIHLRSAMADFDGEGLQLAFNRDSRRIEYLRVEKGDQVIIRKVGDKALALTDNATTAPANAATRSAPSARAMAGTRPDAQPLAATEPAQTTPAAPLTYKLAFDQDVRTSVGIGAKQRLLTSSQLYLLFIPSSGLAGGDTGAGVASATAPAGGAGGGAAVVAPAATRTDPGDHALPIAEAGPDDLVVKWSGFMEMRPAGDQELKLVDGRDVALEAVGTQDKPVQVHDGQSVASAGRLRYHAFGQRPGETQLQGVITLEPEAFEHVVLLDPGRGQVDCRAATIYQKDNRVELLGPGTFDSRLAASAAGAAAGGAGGGKKAGGGGGAATTVAWNQQMDLELAQVRDSKNPATNNLAIRRAVIRGVAIRSDTFDLSADLLDALIANTGDAKQPQALEHLLATGNVVAHSLRRNRVTILPTDSPDGLSAPRLEVLTVADGATGIPVPSQMIASGSAGAVKAWRLEDETKDQAAAGTAVAKSAPAFRKEMITTSRLVADMKPRADAAADHGAASALAAVSVNDADLGDLGQNFPAVTHLFASGGAQVEITPPPGPKAVPILVMADSLDADPVARTAILKAADGAPKEVVRVAMGENSIEGQTLLIDQAADTFKVDGGGQMLFMRATAALPGSPDAKAAKAPTPMRVTWTKNMVYNNKEKLALFYGSPLAQIVDEDPDRGFLKCDDVLKVQGVKDSAATRPAVEGGGFADAGKFELDTIEADGKVEARGEQIGADNAVLMRIRINSEKLVYHDVSKTFAIPGPGFLVVDNNRPEKPGETTNTAGSYDFQWQGGLNYDGSANTIKFLDQVRFVFQPKKPFNLTSSPLLGGGSTTLHKVNEVRLDTDRLVTTLMKTRDAVKTTANPIGLGEGGNMEISKVDADGNAHLVAGEFELTGDTLHFDALTHTAVVKETGTGEATFIQPGQGEGFAPEIDWDMTKDHNAVSLPKGFRANIQGTGNIPGN